jgi:hypothetical protein
MNYLTNYYKNLSEQLQAKVNYLQSLMEEQTPNKKGMKLSIIDRVSGSASSDSGVGAQYIAMGEDGKHYSFRSDAQWAYDNEDPSQHAPKTYEVHTGNPKHEIEDLREINWNDKHDAHEFNNYRPRLNEANIRNPTDQLAAGRRSRDNNIDNNIFRFSAGWNRMNDMLHYQAAHAIAEPHEQEAIERVLTDMAGSGTGTLADMGHMRTAVGAVKRLKGTEDFAKSLSSVRAPIEQESLSRAKQNLYSLHNVNMKDVKAGDLTPREEEEMDDHVFDVSQERILGSRKKK